MELIKLVLDLSLIGKRFIIKEIVATTKPGCPKNENVATNLRWRVQIVTEANISPYAVKNCIDKLGAYVNINWIFYAYCLNL